MKYQTNLGVKLFKAKQKKVYNKNVSGFVNNLSVNKKKFTTKMFRVL